MSLTKVSHSMISGAAVYAADFGASTTNTASQNSTAIQSAIDFASQNGKTLDIEDLYDIDAPLVIQGNTGGLVEGGFTIRGASGSLNFGFRKQTHTTYAGIDTLIYLELPSGATYTSNITISNLWINGDIDGDQRTDLVDFAIYAPSPISTVVIEDCSLSAKTCIDFYNAFIYTIRRVNMWPKNKGIRIQSGTTGRIEECFVQSALLIAYELWGEYSSIASCACDGAEGVAYYFRGGSWQAGGLGCESTGLAQQVVYVREAQVSIDGMRIHHPAGEFVTVFYSEVSAHLRVSNVSFGNFTGNTTAAGYLYQVATSSTIELSNITLSAKPFKYASAVSTSCTQRLKNIGPISGDASKFGNLYPIAGQTYGDFDQFLGAGSSVKGAAIYFGGSDTNPAADATIRFDDGVPLHSIILNTRGSVAATYGWICTATAATISASTFVAWV
jgi:hypothetical protein